ncbi:MAG: hypothetical protein ONB48_13480 [candidate division KSB1 bacterium]|nr:hypothetical protein [candidate division KSB1 bacterium]MDZ7274888.1 hypothetical protein [candidate division KSB1 bacterium]MDZ7286660.1 hypothetical protein [candidate division KSB1 bacterium]MDZ7299177.1 hypothetical protein [candidate division KSB1 bacterium]MDZ7307013.1 hypothetical protein [candidate division KSB1 bacterium]
MFTLPARRVLITLLLFLPLVLYDVLFGGAIAALLQTTGWQGVAQRINNVYQLSYGVLVAAVLVLAAWRFHCPREALAVLVLYAGMVEDTLFYLLIKPLNPVISLLTLGAGYRAPERILPEGTASWPGWVGRMFLEASWWLSPARVFVLNLVAVLLAAAILAGRTKVRLSNSEKKSAC